MPETPNPTFVIFNRTWVRDGVSRWVALVTYEDEPSQGMYGGPGDTVIYKAAGRRDGDGLPPRFELEGKFTIEPPPKPKAEKVLSVEGAFAEKK